MQLIFYGGAGHPLAQLPNIDWYLGMMLVYAHRLFTKRDTKYATLRQTDLLPISICDFIGTVGTTVGLEYAGSAIFGIIFASVTVWSALFSCLIMGKRQTKKQMWGILVVVIGLAIPALEQSDSDPQDESEVHIGIFLTCVGTLFYSVEYVLCERVFTLFDKPCDAREVCFYTGVWGLAFTMVWVSLVTVPRWDELVSSEMAARGGSPLLILFLYFTHCLNNSAHNVSWFTVCELEGGVSTGLLMGIKAASLFFFSALFFCSPDHPEQCMTILKLISTIVVVAGTGIYYDMRLPRVPASLLPRRKSLRGMRRLAPEFEATELGALPGESIVPIPPADEISRTKSRVDAPEFDAVDAEIGVKMSIGSPVQGSASSVATLEGGQGLGLGMEKEDRGGGDFDLGDKVVTRERKGKDQAVVVARDGKYDALVDEIVE